MIKLAKIEGLPVILDIYEYAKNFMKENNNPTQWEDNFPSKKLLEKDIESEQLYVYEENNIFHGE